MNLYIDNHKYHYESENLTRAFLFSQDVNVIHSFSALTPPFILTSVRDDVSVRLCAGDTDRTLRAPLSDNDELAMARMLYELLSDYTGMKLPWGMLTGVRPIKLFSKLTEDMGEDGARKYFTDTLLVSDSKTALAEDISRAQREIISRSARNSFSLYVSIPFCPTRCSYCSFVSQSIEKAGKLLEDYFPLLLKEITKTALIASRLGLKLESVYIGGGTPTTLDAEKLSILISHIGSEFDLRGISEFTVEAGRPDTVTREKLIALKNSPVTRISINPQTFSDEVLGKIGRKHTTAQTLEAFDMARSVGLDNINMDFIAGLPSDTVAGFCRSIEKAVSLSPESITVHTLAVKRSSRLAASDIEKEYGMTGEMLDFAEKELRANGYIPYYLYRQSKMLSNLENIGWAKKGCFSPYNIYIMEETHSILACGAGAVTKLRDVDSNHIERIFNFKYPYEYNSRFNELIERKDRISSFYETYNR